MAQITVKLLDRNKSGRIAGRLSLSGGILAQNRACLERWARDMRTAWRPPHRSDLKELPLPLPHPHPRPLSLSLTYTHTLSLPPISPLPPALTLCAKEDIVPSSPTRAGLEIDYTFRGTLDTWLVRSEEYVRGLPRNISPGKNPSAPE